MGRLGILCLLIGLSAGCGSDLLVDDAVTLETTPDVAATSLGPSAQGTSSTQQRDVESPVVRDATILERQGSTTVSEVETVLLGVSPDGRFSYSFRHPELLVDAGSGLAPALNDERDGFKEIRDFTFGGDDLVGWVSYDDNFGGRALLGRIADNGVIVDVHPLWGDAQQLFEQERNLAELIEDAVEYGIDPESDPFYVMSADSPPVIDTSNPLVPVLESEGHWARSNPGNWYVGETLGVDPACGASTLYKDDADGFARVLAGDVELDTITTVDASEMFTGAIDTAFAQRLIVLTTQCADESWGRRVYVGWESVGYGDGGPRFEYPLFVTPLVNYEVAEVISVNVVPLDEGDCCTPSRATIDIELPNGEVETVPWP